MNIYKIYIFGMEFYILINQFLFLEIIVDYFYICLFIFRLFFDFIFLKKLLYIIILWFVFDILIFEVFEDFNLLLFLLIFSYWGLFFCVYGYFGKEIYI